MARSRSRRPHYWEYESARERRARQLAAFQEAASDALWALQQGDIAGARRAVSPPAPGPEEPVAQLSSGLRVPVDVPPAPVRSPSPDLVNVGLQFLSAGKRLTDYAGGPPRREKGLLDRIGETLGDIVPEPVKRATGAAIEALDVGRRYVGGPAFAVLSGQTEARRVPITDARGNVVGYYREAPDFRDVLGSIGEVFTRSPAASYREARQAHKERLQNPELSAFGRTLLAGAADPLLYIPVGAVSAAARGARAPMLARVTAPGVTGASAAARAGMAGRLARAGAGLLEAPGPVSAGALLGTATAAQLAESQQLSPQAQMFLQLAGGIAGGVAGARVPPALRAIRQQGLRETLAGQLPGAPVAAMTRAERANVRAQRPPDVVPAEYSTAIPQRTIDTNLHTNLRAAETPRPPRIGRAIEAPNGLLFGVLKPFDRWIQETERLLTPAEIDEWARWYANSRAGWQDVVGPEDAPRFEDAWLVANRRTSPEIAVLNVLRAEDLELGKPRVKGAGTADMEKAIRSTLRGEHAGLGQKITDFFDSARLRDTRTWVGDDPRGGGPFVGDVWAARDAGYIDSVVADRLGVPVSEDMLDTPRKAGSMKPDALQYETISRWGNDLTRYLNEIGWRGRTDWKPYEVQAIGWGKVRKAYGMTGGTLDDALAGQTRRVAFELAFGEGSPLGQKYDFYALRPEQQRQVTADVLNNVVDWVQRNVPGVRVRQRIESIGGYEDYPVAPSWQLDVFGSPETAMDVADAIGYLAQQTEVAVWRPVNDRARGMMGIDVFLPPGRGTEDMMATIYAELRKRVPDLVGGFSPTKSGDQWSMRIVDFGGAWPSPGSPGYKRLESALGDIARDLDVDLVTRNSRFDATIVGNPWTEAPDGQAYLARLVSRGRSDLSGALARAAPERDAWVADAWARASAQPAFGADAAAGFVGSRGTAGDVLRQSFGAGNNALAIAARGSVAYLQAKLEGKSDEEALAQALALMAPGAVSRTAMRVQNAASAVSALDAIPSAVDARLPDYSSAHILDLPPLEPQPLSRIDELANLARRVFGLPEEDPIATTAMRAREKLRNVVDSQANREGATIGAIVRDAFEMDEKGRIATLPGRPTIQDVAAKLPFMEPFMTPRQRLVMAQLREHIEPYTQMLRSVNPELGSRADIVDGGFYLPRGRADLEGADAPRARVGVRRVGGKIGAERHAVFESMARGIDEGFEYAPIEEAIASHVRDVGNRIVNHHIAEYFRSVTDDSGIRVGTTPADRMPTGIKAQWDYLTGRLASYRAQLRTLERRAGQNAAWADELDAALQRFEQGIPDEGTRGVARSLDVLESIAMKGQALEQKASRLRAGGPQKLMTGGGPVRINMPPTDRMLRQAAVLEGRAEAISEVVRKVGDLLPEDVERMEFLETAVRRTLKRAEELAQRGDQYGQQAMLLRNLISVVEDELLDLKPRYRMALERARQTPRGYAPIAMAELTGWAFPEAVAAAANKHLAAELTASGRLTSPTLVVNALNQILRGIRATADVSFMGIQGALGFARSPRAYGRALKVAFRSMQDPVALGRYLLDYDARMSQAGRLTSVDWARYGLRVASTDTEFRLGAGLPAAVSDVVGRLPVTSHANRAFGTFGDVLRMELADLAYRHARSGGFDVNTSPVRESIAGVVNRATGWSPNRFAGDWGELAMFAPRFFQSQLEFLATAAQRGTAGGYEARRMMLQFLGLGTLLTLWANEALGEPITTEELLDPTNSNFMRIRIGGQDVSIFGPWDSLVRGMVKTAQGDPTYALRSRASPTVAAAWNLISGETFTGEPARTPGAIVRELLLPFSVSDSALFGGDRGLVGTAVGLTGLKATPMSPTDELNMLARARFGAGFYDLEPSQQAVIKREHPEIWQRAVDAGSERRQEWEELKARYAAEQEQRDAMLLSGDLRLEDWRDARATALAEKRGAQEVLFRDQAFRRDNENDLLARYFAAFDAATVNGVFYPERVDEFLATLAPDERDFIERNTGLSMTPLEQLRSRLAREYYALPRYRGYTADEAREIDQVWQDVRNRSRSTSPAQMLSTLNDLFSAESLPARILSGVRRRILGLLREDPAREAYRRQHPEVVLLDGDGVLSPAVRQHIARLLER